jgi:hypothetical protein
VKALQLSVHVLSQEHSDVALRHLFCGAQFFLYQNKGQQCPIMIVNERLGLRRMLTPVAYNLFPMRTNALGDPAEVVKGDIHLKWVKPLDDTKKSPLLDVVAFATSPFEVLAPSDQQHYFPCVVQGGTIQGFPDHEITEARQNLDSQEPQALKAGGRCRAQRKHSEATASLLVNEAQYFHDMCKKHPEGFVYVPTSSCVGTTNLDNPGCDFVLVTKATSNRRLVLLVEVKDQRYTNAEQWNAKIQKMAEAPLVKVLNDQYEFVVVLAGRNSSTFVGSK